jgi:hypothetical protein
MDETEFWIIKYLRFLQSSKYLFGKYLTTSEISNTSMNSLEIISLPWITLGFANLEKTIDNHNLIYFSSEYQNEFIEQPIN